MTSKHHYLNTFCPLTESSVRRVGTLVFPSFVEFDMSAEGFGCLFLPSIAPQSASGGSVVGSALSSTEPNVIGGIGTGEGQNRERERSLI